MLSKHKTKKTSNTTLQRTNSKALRNCHSAVDFAYQCKKDQFLLFLLPLRLSFYSFQVGSPYFCLLFKCQLVVPAVLRAKTFLLQKCCWKVKGNPQVLCCGKFSIMFCSIQNYAILCKRLCNVKEKNANFISKQCLLTRSHKANVLGFPLGMLP